MKKRTILSCLTLIAAVSCSIAHWEYTSSREIQELDFGTPPTGAFSSIQSHNFSDENLDEDATATLTAITLTLGTNSTATDLKWLETALIEIEQGFMGSGVFVEIATFDVGATDLSEVTSIALDVTPDINIAPELSSLPSGALVRFTLTGTADGSTKYMVEGSFDFSVEIDL